MAKIVSSKKYLSESIFYFLYKVPRIFIYIFSISSKKQTQDITVILVFIYLAILWSFLHFSEKIIAFKIWHEKKCHIVQ